MIERISGVAHCAHHDQHWEYCYNYAEQVAYIKGTKPANEQALRLKLFQIVPDDKLPGRHSREWAACDEARKAYDEAWEANDEAW